MILPRKARHIKIRKKITGNSKSPRLVVFRSNKHIYAQLVDDTQAKTLASASDLKMKKGNKIEIAKEIGLVLAQKGQKLNIKKVVFDRGGFKYHGRVKALAEGARVGGLVF